MLCLNPDTYKALIRDAVTSLKSMGFKDIFMVAVQDPKLVHAEQRIKAKKFSIYGVEIGSIARLVENGKKLADYRATITINAMKKAQDAFSIR